ncbi:MAG: aldehyde dehydrogenase family protein, partial [Acidimicrobiia bacterium]
MPEPFYVAGEWRESDAARDVHSPYDGRVVGSHFVPTPADLEDALAGAVAVHRDGAPPRHERSRGLEVAARAVEDDAERLARIVVGESAKPLKAARAEVARLASTLRWSSEEARRLDGELLPLDT